MANGQQDVGEGPKLWQEVMAVVGVADEAALAAVSLTAVTDDPIVLEGVTELDEETAVAILTQLEQNDLPRYRVLHERAVVHLRERLGGGEAQLERPFMAVFERLANRLLLDDPEALIALVEQTRHLPMQAAAHRQQFGFFEALALRKAERYEAALAAFDGLLAEELAVALQARVLNSRAVCCFLLGRLEEAQTGYAASLTLWQQLGDKKYEGTVLLNMGIIAYDLQQYDVAQTHLQEAITLFRVLGATGWLAAAENELGLVYRDLGRWQAALAYFDDLIELRRAEGAADNVAIGLLNRGEVLLFQGRLQEAQASLDEALALMPTAVFRVDIYLHLGLAQQALGEWAAAYEAFVNALRVVEEIGRRDVLPQVYYRLGDWCMRQGDVEKGRVWLETAVTVIEDTREPMRDEGFKISLMGKWQQVYERLVLLCLEMEDVAGAFAWMERARARAFTELLLATEGAAETAAEAVLEVVPISTLADVQAALPEGVLLLCYFTTGVLAHDVPLLSAIPASNPLREQLLIPARTLLLAVRGGTDSDLETAVFHDWPF